MLQRIIMRAFRFFVPAGLALFLAGALLTPSEQVDAKSKKPTWTLEWDVQAFDDAGKPTLCSGFDTICTVKYSLVLRQGAVRVGTYAEGKTTLPGHALEAWGKCSGKNKKRGLVCGLINFDCGDNCYGDVLAASVIKDSLVVHHYEGCMGGEECMEAPKTILTTKIGPAKVQAR